MGIGLMANKKIRNTEPLENEKIQYFNNFLGEGFFFFWIPRSSYFRS